MSATTSGPTNPASRYVEVLEDGLPALPYRMTAGVPVPVAVWIDEWAAGVMVLEDCDHDPDCQPTEHFLAMNYIYTRAPAGWEVPQGSAGTDWPGGVRTRTGLPDGAVELDRGATVDRSGAHHRYVSGFAGAAARWVDVERRGHTVRRAVAPSGGVLVVVGADPGRARIRVLDAAGDVLGRIAV